MRHNDAKQGEKPWTFPEILGNRAFKDLEADVNLLTLATHSEWQPAEVKQKATEIFDRWHAAGVNFFFGQKRVDVLSMVTAARSLLSPRAGDFASTATVYGGPKDFLQPYRGKGVKLFQAYLEEFAYSEVARREIPVVQSSGSGKSRLITEATRQNLGILFNVRVLESTAFP